MVVCGGSVGLRNAHSLPLSEIETWWGRVKIGASFSIPLQFWIYRVNLLVIVHTAKDPITKGFK